MLLVFGVAYQIPLFVILLNLPASSGERPSVSTVPGSSSARSSSPLAATPSTDPFSMLFLAIPMMLLFLISEVVARILDKRRGLTRFDGLDDDQASDLDYDRDVIRYSGLDEDED